VTGVESPDERLARAIADHTEAAARRRRLASAEERVRTIEVTVTERRAALAEEESDVERLEHLSWTRIVAGLRGRHATDLERETAERDAARYAVREAEARLDQAQTEVAAARARVGELGDTEAAYRDALAAKEEWVARHAPAQGARLAEIAERRGVLEAEFRESREADDAGVAADKRLASAASLLSSAESWSSWDTFMGGGLITDMVKHSRIDDARAQLQGVERALRAFGRELADVQVQGVDALALSGMLSAFDVWFDNIFSDWTVLRRIQDAEARVSETRTQVRTVIGGLRERRNAINDELTGLIAERERLLTDPS
jgi:hypothetical protein